MPTVAVLRPAARSRRPAPVRTALAVALALVIGALAAPPAVAHDGLTHVGTPQTITGDPVAIATAGDLLATTAADGSTVLHERRREGYTTIATSAPLPGDAGLVPVEVAVASTDQEVTAVLAAQEPRRSFPTQVALAPFQVVDPPAPIVYGPPVGSVAFGTGIAATGPLVFIGGLRNDSSGRGYVSIIDLTERDANGVPVAPGVDLESPRSGENWFGRALDTDGSTLVVSADPAGSTATVLYVYEMDPDTGLGFPQRIEVPDLDTDHVAVHDDVIIAGEGFFGAASDEHSVVLRRDAEGTWREVQRLGPTVAVALAPDRMLAHTGGGAQLFTVDSAGRFVPDRQLTSNNSSAGLGLTDRTAAVIDPGAPPGEDPDVALAFHLPPPTRTVLTAGSGATAGTITATVTGGATTPTGTMTFRAGGQPIARCQALPLVEGAATCRPETSGTLTVDARYAGTDVHGPSRSGDVTVELTATPTTTFLLAMFAPEGDEVVLGGEVTAPGGPVSGGTVTIAEEGLPIPGCINLPVGEDGRTAACRPDRPGVRSFQASYTPAPNLLASSSSPRDIFVPAVRATPNPARAGKQVTLTGALASASAGSTLRFFADAASPAVCEGVVVADTRVATCTTTFPLGDGTVELSIGTGTTAPTPNDPAPRRLLQVQPAITPTVVLSDSGDAVTGEPHPITALVTGPEQPAPTGSVAWTTPEGDPVPGCPDSAIDSTGRARCPLTPTAPGEITVVGTYLGDSRYDRGSDSLAVDVLQAAAVTLTASPSPSVVGQVVTYTVVVDGGDAGTPTGTVSVLGDGAGLSCDIVLVGGAGSCTLRHQEVGTVGMIATYDGDGVVGPGRGRLDQVVRPAQGDGGGTPPLEEPTPPSEEPGTPIVEPVPPAEEPVVDRLGGQPRGETSASGSTALVISQQRFEDASAFQQVGGRQATGVVLSRDDVFADSLAGSALTTDAPLLLTRPDALDPVVLEEIDRLLGGSGTVHLLGGEAALGPAVADALAEAGYDVRRLAGTSRIETALAVADEVRRTRSGDSVGIARAFGTTPSSTDGWADAVAAGAWAARTGSPVLLTPGDALHPSVADWLEADATTRPVVLGGEAAVAQAVVDAIADATRVDGTTRYATAVEIARQLWPVPPAGYLVTAGDHVDGWAYALAGAGLGADLERPLLLVETDRLPAEVDAALPCSDGERPPATILGDETVVSPAVAAGLARC